MAMRASNVTATIAGGANQRLLFTLVVPNVPNPILRYYVVSDSADGTLFPVPYTVTQQLDSSDTLGAGLDLISPQDIELWFGGAWITSGAYYAVSGAGVSLLTTNFAYSGSTRDLSSILAPTPTPSYTTADVTIAIPPPPAGSVIVARATLSSPCFYAPRLIVPTSAQFTCVLASDGTGTLQLIPNDMLTPVNPSLTSADVVWQVQVAGASLSIQVPDVGGDLTDLLVGTGGGSVVPIGSISALNNAMSRLYAAANFI